MESKIKIYNRIGAIVVFIGLPVMFWALSEVPHQSVLRESISVITLLAFSFMLLQFYLSRINRPVLKEHNMGKVLKWHKTLGYIFVVVLLIHPFLVILPRYYESGIDPKDAFMTMITTFSSPGIILGMIAWCLMFLIGLTSLIRKILPLSYKTWRLIHGILSIAFIITATLHVLKLGRHIDKSLSVFIIILAAGGVFLLIRTYILSNSKKA